MQTAKPDLCGNSEVSEAYSSIEGTVPLFSRPIVTLPSTTVTSLVTKQEAEHTVIYLGTQNGALQKVCKFIKSGFCEVMYEWILINHESLTKLCTDQKQNLL